MDPMKVQIEVRAGQQGCPLESKLRSGLQADGLSQGRAMGPKPGRGKSSGGAGVAVVTGGRPLFKIRPRRSSGLRSAAEIFMSSQYSWGSKKSPPSPQGPTPPLPTPPLLLPALPGSSSSARKGCLSLRLSAWPPHALPCPPYSEISSSCSPSIPKDLLVDSDLVSKVDPTCDLGDSSDPEPGAKTPDP